MKATRAAKKPVDPYLTDARTIVPRNGFSIIDEFRSGVRSSIRRTFNTAVEKAYRRFDRRPEELLAQGAAVGVDAAGHVRHIRPENGILGFRGFVEGSLLEDRVQVCTSGALTLHIPELLPGDEGKAVYALAPDTFTLSPEAGAVSVGIVQRRVMDAMLPTALVEFRAADDRVPIAKALPLRHRDFFSEKENA